MNQKKRKKINWKKISQLLVPFRTNTNLTMLIGEFSNAMTHNAHNAAAQARFLSEAYKYPSGLLTSFQIPDHAEICVIENIRWKEFFFQQGKTNNFLKLRT